MPAMTRITNGSAPDPPTTFRSILYRHIRADVPTEQAEAPEFFHDLNIDQIVAAVTGEDEYDLKPIFYRQLADVDEIAYRQRVMKDLESPRLFARIGGFAEKDAGDAQPSAGGRAGVLPLAQEWVVTRGRRHLLRSGPATDDRPDGDRAAIAWVPRISRISVELSPQSLLRLSPRIPSTSRPICAP
jgi:hypothetical protein